VHGPENTVDGDISTYWQSPPISRGRKYNRVDLEINLLQDFIVSSVLHFVKLVKNLCINNNEPDFCLKPVLRILIHPTYLPVLTKQ